MDCKEAQKLFDSRRKWTEKEEQALADHLDRCPLCTEWVDQRDKEFAEEILDFGDRLKFQEEESRKPSAKRPIL